MKKYRRLSAFILALTLCIGLSACGANESSTGTASSETEITTEITTETSSDETTDSAAESSENDRPDAPPDGDKPDAPPDGNGGGTPPGGGAPGGGSSADIDYQSAVEITAADTQSGQTYNSSTADESALLIATADDVTIINPTVTKTGDSDGGDNCNFYGLNAAVLVKDGANVTIINNGLTVLLIYQIKLAKIIKM